MSRFRLLSSPSSISPAVALLAIVLAATTSRAQDSHPGYVVRLSPGTSPRHLIERIAARVPPGALPTLQKIFRGRSSELLSSSRLDRYFVLQGASDHVLRLLAGDPAVESIQPNHRYRLDAFDAQDDDSIQWALNRIEAEEAWRHTLGSRDVLIGFIDTGIEFTHPELAPSLWINPREDRNGNGRFDPWSVDDTVGGVLGDIDGLDQDANGYVDDVIGFDFVDQVVPNVGDWSGRDGVPHDENAQYHGTSVAGVMSAARRNGAGIAGLAPASPLVTLRAFDATGNGEDDDVAAAIVYAADVGVRVLNMSFGDAFNSTLLLDAVRYAHSRGVVLVASAGNDGSGLPHFPSSWSEVISVAMTDSNDSRHPFSNYGQQLSLSAPGVSIVTTSGGGGYARVGGTSIAAPHVAAAAALLLAQHGSWSPLQVRSVLELAADDRFDTGWDPFYGAGRLNVRRALEFAAPAAIEIAAPEYGVAFSRDTSVAIVGTAASPFLASWQLFVGTGEFPDEQSWRPLTAAVPSSRVHDVLATLETGALADTAYTLRLKLTQTDGRTTERRTSFRIDRTRPVLARFEMSPVWRFDERALAVEARTDEPTRVEVRVRPASGGEYRAIALEPERTGFMRNHYLLITSLEIPRGQASHLFVIATNAAGDTTMVGSPGRPLELTLSDESFPVTGFQRKSYTLPYGVVDDERAPLYGTSSQALAMNRFENGDYGKLMVFDFIAGAFVAKDSVDARLIPRGVGDIDGDGMYELLVQAGSSTRVYGQTQSGGSVVARMRWSDTLAADTTLRRTVGAGLRDADGDGRSELISRSDPAKIIIIDGDTLAPHYLIADWNGGDFDVAARLANTTAPARGESRNEFGIPAEVFVDVDGDGRRELLVADDDADFMLFRSVGSGAWELMWKKENEGKGGSEMIASGDFDADGRQEIVIGWRAEILLRNADEEYDAPFWTVQVIRIQSDGSDSLLWSERFAYVRPTDPFRSGVSAGDLDGRPGDELAISTFPGVSIFRWNPTRQTLAPFWWRYGSVINDPIVADFDRDGVPEIGIGNTRLIEFFQSETDAARPHPPAGLRGWSLNDSSAYIEWSSVAGDPLYRVYRGILEPGRQGEPVRLTFIDSTRQRSFVDTGTGLPSGRLISGAHYVYAVTTVDSLESDIAAPVTVFIHPQLRLRTARPESERAIRLGVDGLLAETLYRPGAVAVRRRDGSVVDVSSVTTAGDSALAVHLTDAAPGETILIRLTRLFRDAWFSPGDTLTEIELTMPDVERAGERFVAVSAQLVILSEQWSGGGRAIAIEFSDPVDSATASDVANYVLSPPPIGGDQTPLNDARVSPDDPTVLWLALGDDYPLGALGRRYFVTIRGVRSADGRLLNNGGESVVGFTFEADGLAGVMVYPQPFSITADERATFARLPRGARVEIFDKAARLMRTLEETEHLGGVEWDGRDEHGNLVPSGIYLFRVLVDGEESELKKIAVVE